MRVVSVVSLCDPMDDNPPGSSVYRIILAKILKWVAISFLQWDLPNPGIKPVSLVSPALASRFSTTRCHLGSP